MNMDILFLEIKQYLEKNQMNLQMVMLLTTKKFKMSMMVKTILFKMKVLQARDIIFTCKLKKNQMNLPMEMPLMIKKFKMSMMAKMISFKMKVLRERDIIFTLKLIILVTRKDIITSVRDTQMKLPMEMLLMIKKFKMSMIQRIQLFKMKVLLERDIIFMHKNTKTKRVNTDYLKDILMNLQMVMQQMIKKFRMSMTRKIQLSKMKDSLVRDIICMLKRI